MNMNAQELIETLEWRYATKVFNPDRRIPAEDWEALLESLHLSPSSLGLQMWKFLTATTIEEIAFPRELNAIWQEI